MDEKIKFIESLKKSINDKSFIRIVFGKYRGDDKEFEKIFVTRIETTGGEKLSFKFRYTTKDIVKNFDLETGIKLIDEILGKDFFSATLFTSANDITIDYSRKRIPQLFRKSPSKTSAENSLHNKVKARFIKEDAKYFHLLGISTKEGKVKAGKYDKYRQVDKFIEIVDSLYRSSNLSNKDEIKIFDMGSGKSYMTFAVYDYFANTLKKNISMTGIEQRQELVDLSNKTAADSGFGKLNFINGTIDNIINQHADIVVALHACDTATDDAIVNAIKSNAEIIILAPCCHKYLRKKITSPEAMKAIYKHGILEERLSVSLTDGLRALMLEYYGYETKVFEFISSEHTAKNTMITGVKKNNINEDKLNEINQIKREFHIDDFYLDRKLKKF